ncbi:MAG: bifunctional 4-hydroxy-2-oxoglutarate aldolase/2-dehydro-3-deoxy-phosphogluconate aldolase [Lachnospiraceae bacterium]|nr:bifunctional 4-hydroxy-2-oxoglutarate aldolase/2-dehydro-3-deoxy-phosphogluconate aldolase [Lachnospiraceae bacterium]
MNKVIDKISKIGIVPVIALDDAKDAAPLAKALSEGGIDCAEVTFRTAAAKDTIRIIAKNYPDMLVGAGTVLTQKQVDEAVEAGAEFIVSPGLNPQVVAYCIEKGVPVVPGTSTPSDVETALSLGLEVVKFFPAEAAGGIGMIKAMSAPYGGVKFMPTGGINADNLNQYLDFSKVIACGGSWMVKKDLIKAGDFDKIKELTEQAVTKMLGFRVCRIGINTPDDKAAELMADSLVKAFGFEKKDEGHAVSASDAIHFMKKKGIGTVGYIAVQTNYLERAVYHLEKRGITFHEDTFLCDEKGNKKAVCLKDEIGGFAICVCQK